MDDTLISHAMALRATDGLSGFQRNYQEAQENADLKIAQFPFAPWCGSFTSRYIAGTDPISYKKAPKGNILFSNKKLLLL